MLFLCLLVALTAGDIGGEHRLPPAAGASPSSARLTNHDLNLYPAGSAAAAPSLRRKLLDGGAIDAAGMAEYKPLVLTTKRRSAMKTKVVDPFVQWLKLRDPPEMCVLMDQDPSRPSGEPAIWKASRTPRNGLPMFGVQEPVFSFAVLFEPHQLLPVLLQAGLWQNVCTALYSNLHRRADPIGSSLSGPVEAPSNGDAIITLACQEAWVLGKSSACQVSGHCPTPAKPLQSPLIQSQRKPPRSVANARLLPSAELTVP